MAINDQFKKLDKKRKRMFFAAAIMELEVSEACMRKKLAFDDFKNYEREIVQDILDKINNGVKVELVYVDKN